MAGTQPNCRTQQKIIMLILFLIHVTQANWLEFNKNACSRLYDYPIKDVSRNCYVNQDVMALTPSLIKQNGYSVLSYNVTTPDGYNLRLFRIPPKENDYRKNKQPVFLEHGLFHDSSSWTFVGKRSLAFTLADRGYDVWLANQRGTRYSRTNTKYSASSFDYWTYSMDNIAANDIPTFLAEIANTTGQAGSIIYIGHSRGTTLVYMYASENPEQAQKFLRGIVALCPIVYFDMVWYFKRLVTLAPFLGKVVLSLKISAIFYRMEKTFKRALKFCSMFPYICKYVIDVTSGQTWQFLPEDLLVYFSHSPSTEAVMQILHYAQMAISGKFQKYDYGKRINLKKYGQKNPPLYRLRNVQVPVYMFYGQNDIFIKNQTVQKVCNELGSTEKGVWKIPTGVNDRKDQFSHNDFIWAKDLDTFLYPKLFSVLERQLPPN